MPLLVAIPLLAGGGGGLVAALSSAATKAAIALGLIAFIGETNLCEDATFCCMYLAAVVLS